MTGSVATALLVLGVLDSAFSGFRASLGRTGLVRHRRSDVVGAGRGAALGALLLLPAVAAFAVDVGIRGSSPTPYGRAGEVALVLFVPYAGLTFAALAAYALLGWRQRYLASALVLGPFTLGRPLIVVAGSLWGLLRVHDLSVTFVVVLSIAGVLAVEPLAGRWWYASRSPAVGATSA